MAAWQGWVLPALVLPGPAQHRAALPDRLPAAVGVWGRPGHGFPSAPSEASEVRMKSGTVSWLHTRMKPARRAGGSSRDKNRSLLSVQVQCHFLC